MRKKCIHGRQSKFAEQPLFKEVNSTAGISYRHKDIEFIDFNIQTTLPHKLSEYCPALAAGDIDGNGFDDMVIGGNTFTHAQFFCNSRMENFYKEDLLADKQVRTENYKDAGFLLFDAERRWRPGFIYSQRRI